jgi:Late embryogenesis abundant protein
MKSTRLFTGLLVGLLVVSLTTGCAFLRLARSEKLKVPEVTYLRTVIKSYNTEKATVDFVINAKNPNKIGLKNVAVDYQLFHEGRAFLKGDGIEVSLVPAGDTEIRIPAVIAYSSVFSTASALTQRIIAGDSTVPVHLDAVVSGKPTLYNEVEQGSLFSFTKKVSHTEDIPIPRKQLDNATDAAKNRVIDSMKKRF